MADEIKNIQKEPLNKTLQWYFNPVEQVRMLRYMPLQTKFTKETLIINENPVYPLEKDIKVAVSMFVDKDTNPRHLDLQLYYLTEVNKLTGRVFVLYANDSITDELLQTIKKYDIVYSSQPRTLYKQIGIGNLNKINLLFESLQWAKELKTDILFIIDVDLIPCYRWINDIKKLAFETDGYTFTSYNSDWVTFRTEMIGFNVKMWGSQTGLYSLNWLLENECTIMEEVWFHEVAKMYSASNWSERYRNYIEINKNDYTHLGYVKYTDILGTDINTNQDRNENVLWKGYSKEEDYERRIEEIVNKQ
jgi:hypothetical protein